MSLNSIISSIQSIYSAYSIYIIMGVSFASVFLLVLSIGLIVIARKTRRRTVKSRLAYYSTEKEEEIEIPPFSERVIMPLLNKAASFIRKLSPRGVVESTRQKLELAGILEKLSVNVYLMIKFLSAVLFLIIFILLFVFLDLTPLLIIALLILIPLFYLLPDVFLRSKIEKRQEEIRRMLPNALDMLTITVEAGMGFDAALTRVAGNIKGPLGEEFNKMLKEMNIGLTRREAFHNLVKRTSVPDLDSFVTSVIQAEILGISIGKILKIQASEIRNRRSIRAEEAGIKAPVKLALPLIICLVPALLAIIIGPAIIMIYEGFIGFLK
jgi:tight adherence protein C